MDRTWAVREMMLYGEKVRHKTFKNDQYIYMTGHSIFDQDGKEYDLILAHNLQKDAKKWESGWDWFERAYP